MRLERRQRRQVFRTVARVERARTGEDSFYLPFLIHAAKKNDLKAGSAMRQKLQAATSDKKRAFEFIDYATAVREKNKKVKNLYQQAVRDLKLLLERMEEQRRKLIENELGEVGEGEIDSYYNLVSQWQDVLNDTDAQQVLNQAAQQMYFDDTKSGGSGGGLRGQAAGTAGPLKLIKTGPGAAGSPSSPSNTNKLNVINQLEKNPALAVGDPGEETQKGFLRLAHSLLGRLQKRAAYATRKVQSEVFDVRLTLGVPPARGMHLLMGNSHVKRDVGNLRAPVGEGGRGGNTTGAPQTDEPSSLGQVFRTVMQKHNNFNLAGGGSHGESKSQQPLLFYNNEVHHDRRMKAPPSADERPGVCSRSGAGGSLSSSSRGRTSTGREFRATTTSNNIIPRGPSSTRKIFLSSASARIQAAAPPPTVFFYGEVEPEKTTRLIDGYVSGTQTGSTKKMSGEDYHDLADEIAEVESLCASRDSEDASSSAFSSTRRSSTTPFAGLLLAACKIVSQFRSDAAALEWELLAQFQDDRLHKLEKARESKDLIITTLEARLEAIALSDKERLHVGEIERLETKVVEMEDRLNDEKRHKKEIEKRLAKRDKMLEKMMADARSKKHLEDVTGGYFSGVNMFKTTTNASIRNEQEESTEQVVAPPATTGVEQPVLSTASATPASLRISSRPRRDTADSSQFLTPLATMASSEQGVEAEDEEIDEQVVVPEQVVRKNGQRDEVDSSYQESRSAGEVVLPAEDQWSSTRTSARNELAPSENEEDEEAANSNMPEGSRIPSSGEGGAGSSSMFHFYAAKDDEDVDAVPEPTSSRRKNSQQQEQQFPTSITIPTTTTTTATTERAIYKRYREALKQEQEQILSQAADVAEEQEEMTPTARADVQALLEEVDSLIGRRDGVT
ncbi:unnamed protein product [Amoebophrya sp. A25]|nr:unnamed protein product [Amoebophrya sp. A25]|eukprot:GSA25T00012968001.1